MLKKTWLKQMELIIKICDPPPLISTKKEKSLINYGTLFSLWRIGVWLYLICIEHMQKE